MSTLAELNQKIAALRAKQNAGIRFVGRDPILAEEKETRINRELLAAQVISDKIVKTTDQIRKGILAHAEERIAKIPLEIAKLQAELAKCQSMLDNPSIVDGMISEKGIEHSLVRPPDRGNRRKTPIKDGKQRRTVSRDSGILRGENPPDMVKFVGNTMFVIPRT